MITDINKLYDTFCIWQKNPAVASVTSCLRDEEPLINSLRELGLNATECFIFVKALPLFSDDRAFILANLGITPQECRDAFDYWIKNIDEFILFHF